MNPSHIAGWSSGSSSGSFPEAQSFDSASRYKCHTKDPEVRRAKQREYQQAWYAQPKNHKQQNASVKRCQQRYKRLLKAEVDQLKRGPCAQCGQQFEVEAMDFDHRPGEEKTGNVSSLLKYGRKRVMAEIAKCDLVCATCHRVRTKARRQGAQVAMLSN